MAYEQVWALLGILWILASAALFLVREHLRRRHEQRLREMLHRERMLALERQVPLPELLDLQDRLPAPEAGPEPPAWLSRRPALGCGILGMAAGAAVILSFCLSGIAELRESWSLGIVPLLTGLGFVLVHFLERRAGRPQ